MRHAPRAQSQEVTKPTARVYAAQAHFRHGASRPVSRICAALQVSATGCDIIGGSGDDNRRDFGIGVTKTE
jgi:hypothetical protein